MKPLPSVAIVGRPNVGKSTLFNRITGRRRAIVHASPGVTRDVQRGTAEWTGVTFEIIDTGGLFSGVEDDLIGQVEARAIKEALQADALLFVTDGRDGLTPADADVAARVRESGIPVLLVVNKVEKQSDLHASAEFYSLGFGNVHGVSALEGEGIGDLLDDLVAVLPRFGARLGEPELKLAVVGVPNVGKSSLVNALVGEDANIVDERPGTTRDSIDVSVKWHGHRITLVDTAGIKRKSKSIDDDMMVLSAIKSLETIERCDVAVVMLDASRPISNQDVRVGSYAHKAGKGILVCFNKWDLVEKQDRTYREYERQLRDRFAFMSYARVLFVSALTHQRVSKIFDVAWKIKEARETRVPTAQFNKFMEEIVRRNPPAYHGGGTGKIYYGAQVEVAPPTFSVFVNKAGFFGRNYLRYLNNRIRGEYAFDGTQIRINLVEKKPRGKAA